jgi:ABC-type branched-subunit amino acid transport system ATPase component
MTEAQHNGILKVREVVTGYGKKQVVNGVSLDVARGEIVALIGHNGAGKSTLLKAAFGMIPIGQARFISAAQLGPNQRHAISCAPGWRMCHKATGSSQI